MMEFAWLLRPDMKMTTLTLAADTTAITVTNTVGTHTTNATNTMTVICKLLL